jgi:2-amino-4-hydroxy-6-hydroxymethyldihydropteridine diphosphokinase
VTLAAIALGSNVGDREANFRQAVAGLKRLGEVKAVSSFYETDPVGYTDQPKFLNAAALLETELEPLPLLHALIEIERAAGRDRSIAPPKGPRTLDLDLLLYGDCVLSGPELTLPHPEMHTRRFVLEPLAEIAPRFVHPAQNKTIIQLLHGLPHDYLT